MVTIGFSSLGFAAYVPADMAISYFNFLLYILDTELGDYAAKFNVTSVMRGESKADHCSAMVKVPLRSMFLSLHCLILL